MNDLQRLIDATPPHGELRLPRGLYPITETLVASKAINLVLHGVELQWRGPGDGTILCLRSHYGSISGGEFVHQNPAVWPAGGAKVTAIRFETASYWRLLDFSTVGCYTAMSFKEAYFNRIEPRMIRSMRYGVQVDGNANANQVQGGHWSPNNNVGAMTILDLCSKTNQACAWSFRDLTLESVPGVNTIWWDFGPHANGCLLENLYCESAVNEFGVGRFSVDSCDHLVIGGRMNSVRLDDKGSRNKVIGGMW
jgi:hypothetical protein